MNVIKFYLLVYIFFKSIQLVINSEFRNFRKAIIFRNYSDPSTAETIAIYFPTCAKHNKSNIVMSEFGNLYEAIIELNETNEEQKAKIAELTKTIEKLKAKTGENLKFLLQVE